MKVKAEAYREIIETIMRMPNPSRGDLNRIKLEIARKYDLDGIPSNAEIISLKTGGKGEASSNSSKKSHENHFRSNSHSRHD